MRVIELGGVYLVAGVACVLVARRARRDLGARDLALIVLLWPVYLPAVLAPSSQAPSTGPEAAAVARERKLLDEALALVTDATLLGLLPTREQLTRLGAHLAALDRRVRELDDVLARPEFSEEIVRPSADRLRALRAAAARERDELLALCARLRAQVTVVRFAGSRVSDDGELGPLVAEVIGRVEGLGAALDPGIQS